MADDAQLTRGGATSQLAEHGASSGEEEISPAAPPEITTMSLPLVGDSPIDACLDPNASVNQLQLTPNIAKNPSSSMDPQKASKEKKNKKVGFQGEKLFKLLPDSFYEEVQGHPRAALLKGASRNSYNAAAAYKECLAQESPPRSLVEARLIPGSRNTFVARIVPRHDKDPRTELFNNADIACVYESKAFQFDFFARNSLCKLKKHDQSPLYVIVAFCKERSLGAYLQPVYEDDNGSGNTYVHRSEDRFIFRYFKDIEPVFTVVNQCAVAKHNVLAPSVLSDLTKMVYKTISPNPEVSSEDGLSEQSNNEGDETSSALTSIRRSTRLKASAKRRRTDKRKLGGNGSHPAEEQGVQTHNEAQHHHEQEKIQWVEQTPQYQEKIRQLDEQNMELKDQQRSLQTRESSTMQSPQLQQVCNRQDTVPISSHSLPTEQSNSPLTSPQLPPSYATTSPQFPQFHPPSSPQLLHPHQNLPTQHPHHLQSPYQFPHASSPYQPQTMPPDPQYLPHQFQIHPYQQHPLHPSQQPQHADSRLSSQQQLPPPLQQQQAHPFTPPPYPSHPRRSILPGTGTLSWSLSPMAWFASILPMLCEMQAQYERRGLKRTLEDDLYGQDPSSFQ